MSAATWPGNDPTCRRAWDPRHVCCDSQGWPLTGDKACFYETSTQVWEMTQRRRERESV